jgi:hypothetical protein
MELARERVQMHGEIWSDNLKGRNYSEDLGVDGRIILEWILEKWSGFI